MGLEVVVRPVVFPNIRPQKPRVLPAPDNPEQGMVVMSGGGGTFVGTSYSYSYSESSSTPKKERKRQVDKKRVYQKEDNADGSSTINKDNYVDIEQTKKLLLVGGSEPDKLIYQQYKDDDNVEILETDITKIAGKN